MVFLKKRLVFWSIVLLALGGIAVASLMTLSREDRISNNSIAEQAGKRIKVGMTKEQVTEILEGKTPNGLSNPMHTLTFMYRLEDGSRLWLTYGPGPNGRVCEPPTFYESQEEPAAQR